MKEIINKYRLSEAGDKNAILFLLSNMGEGKLLKENNYFRLKWLTELAGQGSNDAFATLFAAKDLESGNYPLYFEPKYLIEEKKKEAEAQFEKQIIEETTAWKRMMMEAEEEEAKRKAEEEKKRVEEEKKRKAEEEEAKRKAEEKKKRVEEEKKRKAEEEEAKRKAEEERKRVEEEKKRKAEEAKRKAEEENKRVEEEQKRKAEEAKLKAEEENKRIEEEKKRKAEEIRIAEEKRELAIMNALKGNVLETFKSLILDMIPVKGGRFYMGSREYPNLYHITSAAVETPYPHYESVDDFWISRSTIKNESIKSLLKGLIDDSIFAKRTLIRCLSHVFDCSFDLPPASALEYAIRGGSDCRKDCFANNDILDIDSSSENTVYNNSDICLIIQKHGFISYSGIRCADFRLYCTDNRMELLHTTIKWNSLVNTFLNETETFEYETGILFFKKKKQIRYLKQPVTNRIWNAIMQRGALTEWGRQDALSMKEIEKKNQDKKIPDPYKKVSGSKKLADFLKNLNDYLKGEYKLDYLHNLKEAENKLRDSGKINKSGAYLIIK